MPYGRNADTAPLGGPRYQWCKSRFPLGARARTRCKARRLVHRKTGGYGEVTQNSEALLFLCIGFQGHRSWSARLYDRLKLIVTIGGPYEGINKREFAIGFGNRAIRMRGRLRQVS